MHPLVLCIICFGIFLAYVYTQEKDNKWVQWQMHTEALFEKPTGKFTEKKRDGKNMIISFETNPPVDMLILCDVQDEKVKDLSHSSLLPVFPAPEPYTNCLMTRAYSFTLNQLKEQISDDVIHIWVRLVLEGLEYLQFGKDLLHGMVHGDSLVFSSSSYLPYSIYLNPFTRKTFNNSPIADEQMKWYSAPEYFDPEYSDEKYEKMDLNQKHRQDVFSLGVCFYQLVTKQVPKLNDKPLGLSLYENSTQNLDILFDDKQWDELWYVRDMIQNYMWVPYMKRETARRTLRHFNVMETFILPKKYMKSMIALIVSVLAIVFIK